MRVLTAMYRVWLYKKHHFIVIIMQIIVPFLILFVLATLNSTLFSKKLFEGNATRYPLLTEFDLYETLKYSENHTVSTTTNRRSRVTYYIKNGNRKLLRIVDKLRTKLANYVELTEVNTEKAILRWSIAHHLRNVEDQYLGGFILEQVLKPNGKTSLNVRIRLARYIPNKWTTLDYDTVGDKTVTYYYPFMGLQLGIFQSYLEFIEDEHRSAGLDPMKSKDLKIQVQGFPYPPHEVYTSLSGFETQQYLAISIALGMTFLVFTIIRAPCTDKENNFKVYLHCMGIPRWIYWLCWIMSDIFVQLISVAFQILLLFSEYFRYNDNMGAIVKRGNVMIWTIFLVLYSFAAVSFCSFIASFSRRGILASYTGATVWLLSYYFSDLFLRSYIVSVTIVTRIALCLVPNAALIWGVTIMLSNAGGIHWDDVFHAFDENLTQLLIPSVMLIVDTLFYYCLALYTDKLRPGRTHGRPWYFRLFCFFPCCVKPVRKLSFLPEDGDDETNYHVLGTDIQSNPFVQIFQLSKEYAWSKGGLNKLNLRFQEGQRTCVVGHHGSGKTTLINILCGAINADSGTVLINNLNLRMDRAQVNAMMSVCMSEDVFSEDTSVIDHLILIGMLKGMSHKAAKLQGIEYLTQLELYKKRNKYPEHLLESERQKLALIMAFMGHSKLVLLDEPTGYLDDDLKPGIWDFIMKHSVGRTLLIATSSMDEAYHLGTKVAIISLGKIVVCGSRVQLEEIFSTGYHLRIKMATDAKPQQIENFVQRYVITSDTLESNTKRMKRALSTVDMDGATPTPNHIFSQSNNAFHTSTRSDISVYLDAIEKIPYEELELESFEKEDSLFQRESKSILEKNILTIQLPTAEGSEFSKLFRVLEEDGKHMEKLGILNWSVCLYDMDDAFYEVNRFTQLMQARRSPEVKHKETSEKYKREMTEILRKSKPKAEQFEEPALGFLLAARFRAILYKRIVWLYGNWAHFLVQILPGILLLIITVQGTNDLFETTLEKLRLGHETSIFPKLVALMKDSGNSTFSKSYLSQFRAGQVSSVIDFETLLTNIDAADTKYVLGADIGPSDLTAMFSSTAFHAGPTSLNVLFNAYLNFKFQGNYTVFSRSYPIQPWKNEILKYYNSSLEHRARIISDEAVQFSVVISFGFFIFISGFIKQPLSEMIWGLKKLQFNISPRGQFMYWLTFFVTDLILTISFSCLLVLILAFLPSHSAFKDREFTKYFLFFCFLAGYAQLISVYIASFILRRVKTSHYAVLSYNQFTGIFLFILTITMEGTAGYVLSYVCRLMVQPYCVSSGFYSILYLAIDSGRCSLISKDLIETLCRDKFAELDQVLPQNPPRNMELCCSVSDECREGQACPEAISYFKVNFEEDIFGKGLWLDVTTLIAHAFMGTFILYFLELGQLRLHYKSGIKERKISKLVFAWDKQSANSNDEAHRLRTSLIQSRDLSDLHPENLYVACVSKKIGKHEVLSSINLIVEPGKVLMILGPPSSGKTTLLKILSHTLNPTSGDVFYRRLSLFCSKQSNKIIPFIGYCPSDVKRFSENYSGLQFLKLFGRLRGIPEVELEDHAIKWLTLLRLDTRAGEYIETYSNSLKRKLLIAATLIGDPPILMFDNPTGDLNPITRSHFWQIIHYLSSECKRIIIIASSSTDSVTEENCHQVAFLVNGRIEIAMSPSECKSKYGLGYTLIIRCKQDENIGFDDYSKLKNQIEKELPGCDLREEESNSLKYFVPNTNLKWSSVFTILEDIKQNHVKIMEEYTVRETTLDDIYESFAVKQIEYTTAESTWDLFCSQYC